MMRAQQHFEHKGETQAWRLGWSVANCPQATHRRWGYLRRVSLSLCRILTWDMGTATVFTRYFGRMLVRNTYLRAPPLQNINVIFDLHWNRYMLQPICSDSPNAKSDSYLRRQRQQRCCGMRG